MFIYMLVYKPITVHIGTYLFAYLCMNLLGLELGLNDNNSNGGLATFYKDSTVYSYVCAFACL